MATATEGYAYSRSSSFSAARSPDTASPIYPERAIRPLPNRRLKSRLSPEQQNTIIYPLSPPPVSPAFSLSVQENGGRALSNGDSPHHHHHHHHHEAIAVHDHCTCEHEHGDSGDEEVEFDHPDYRYATPGHAGINGKAPLDSVQRRLMEASRGGKAPVGPGSVASSADGYESFENTSNKKKRKIPLSSASSSVHQSSLSAEMASMGISHGDGLVDDAALQQQYAHAAASASGTGISGAGRGRYGRQSVRDVRRPLANTNTNAINGYGSRLPAHSGSGSEGRSADVAVDSTTGGIISQAIKTAAEQGPLTPQKGKENISLLQQSASSSATPKTQFTFTCESDSATKMVDQAQAMADAAYRAGYGTPTPGAAPHRAMNGQAMPPGGRVINQGTQTAPPGRAGPAPRAPGPAGVPHPNQPAQHQQPPPAQPKPRRRPSKEYAIAARQRKLQQEYNNYHHRPTKDTMWICEFCEYEDIFGIPPHALIRSYEIKDRAERKKAAEKRRLLEKAKMKNRKGKKNGKGKNNVAAAAAPPPAPPGAYDPNLPPPEGDEYYDEDEYGDEYEPVGPDDHYPADYYPPAPAPTGQPASMHRPGGGGGGGNPPG